MEKILSFDKQGRVYIPGDIRKKLQFSVLVVRTSDKGIILEPIEDDPLKALTKLGKEKLKTKSIKQLKKEARREIEKDVAKKIRRH